METRFAHLNPDKSKMSRVGDAGDGEGAGSETTVTEETGSQSEMDLLKMKIRLRELELEIAREQRGSGQSSRVEGGQESRSELRHLSKLIASVLPKFPTEAEVPVWFEAAESALEAYEVPKEWWGQIIFPLVAEIIPFLSTRLSPHQHRNYEELKGVVLEELKLSAGEYLRRFQGAMKRATEGWRAFATRLQSYLRFYVDARGVSTFEELLELLIADRLKDSLSEAALKYVTLQEAGNWRKASEITSLLLTFEESEGKNSGSKRNEQKGTGASTEWLQKPVKQAAVRDCTKALVPDVRRQPGGCFLCGVKGHFKVDCPRAKSRGTAKSETQEKSGLVARVSTTAVVAEMCEREPIRLECQDFEIRAILDTGADITIIRESAVPPALVEPHGSVKLVSAFGEEVQARLAMLPLTLAQDTEGRADIKERSVLCALTDKLVARTDCLLSEEAWKMLKEHERQEIVPLGERVANPEQVQLGPLGKLSGVAAVHVTPESHSDGSSQAGEQAGETHESDPKEESTAEAVLQKQGKVDMSAGDGLLYYKVGFAQPSQALFLVPGSGARASAGTEFIEGHLQCRPRSKLKTAASRAKGGHKCAISRTEAKQERRKEQRQVNAKGQPSPRIRLSVTGVAKDRRPQKLRRAGHRTIRVPSLCGGGTSTPKRRVSRNNGRCPVYRKLKGGSIARTETMVKPRRGYMARSKFACRVSTAPITCLVGEAGASPPRRDRNSRKLSFARPPRVRLKGWFSGAFMDM